MEEERERLKVLLKHWIEHNEEHGEEFSEWAEKAKGFGEDTVRDNILMAVEQLEEVNRFLLLAWERLTGKKS